MKKIILIISVLVVAIGISGNNTSEEEVILLNKMSIEEKMKLIEKNLYETEQYLGDTQKILEAKK